MFSKLTSSRRWLLGALFAASVGAIAAPVTHPGHRGHPGHHGMMMGEMNPQAMQQHLDGMLQHMAPDATAEQKARIKSIASAAMSDLKPLHEQLRASHQRIHAALSASAVDRRELEAARVEHMRAMDAVSKRMLAAMADAAEVLTPEQRARLVERMPQQR